MIMTFLELITSHKILPRDVYRPDSENIGRLKSLETSKLRPGVRYEMRWSVNILRFIIALDKICRFDVAQGEEVDFIEKKRMW